MCSEDTTDWQEVPTVILAAKNWVPKSHLVPPIPYISFSDTSTTSSVPF